MKPWMILVAAVGCAPEPQLATASAASTMTLVPIADSEVRSGADADTPLGSATFLSVYTPAAGIEARTYLAFDASSLPAGATVTSATLRIYVTNETTDGPTVRRATAAFSEPTITWNNQPGYGATAYGNLGAAPTLNTWYDIALTPSVVIDGVNYLALVGEINDAIRFNSREGTNPPQLVIDYATGSGAPPTNLAADAVSSSAIDLAWDPPSGGATGYYVFRDGAQVATVATAAYRDTGLIASSSHTYTVEAYTGSTVSGGSNAASATTNKADSASSGNGFAYVTHRITPTLSSIGISVDITGDANYATARTSGSVIYRRSGTARWSHAFAPLRIAYAGANQVNGSLLFLTAGTTYDLVIYLQDPDGGARTIATTAATRPVPALGNGTVVYVGPGTTNGNGMRDTPYTLAYANTHATPGTIYHLRGGSYGVATFSTPGASGQYVAWVAEPGETPTFSQAYVTGSWIWLQGLTFRNPPADSDTKFLRQANNPSDVVVLGCDFNGADETMRLRDGDGIPLQRWYIANNTIVGTRTPGDGNWNGEGIDLENGTGNVVAHNSISRVADGISEPGPDSDVFGNDIFDCSDDGIEVDGGGANIRIWGNRIANVNNGFSFQYMAGAPWYFVRNQFINALEDPMKLRTLDASNTVDRFVFAHNTIVNTSVGTPDYVQSVHGYLMLSAIMKNNLWVSADGKAMWDLGGGARDWRTDFDHDGFDPAALTGAYRYNGGTYDSIAAFATASGLEQHAVSITRSTCFTTFAVPTPPTHVTPQYLTLQSWCPAVDAGEVLPDLDDGYAGAAPDLGAYELGAALPVYGPS